MNLYYQQAIELLKKLISIQSFSREEDKTADLLFNWLEENKLKPKRYLNNVYATIGSEDPNALKILINSHHDTVKPGANWDNDPFKPIEKDGKIIGLGSNDAGASVVSLLTAFLVLSKEKLPFQLWVAITAEEEVSGMNGVDGLLKQIPQMDAGIVGEPTQMRAAVAERGLIVLDVLAEGKNGHAARDEGVNAIYEALPTIEWFKNYEFSKISPHLGKVKMTLTQIEAGKQHNVVPDECKMVVDVRLNDLYAHDEVLDIIKENVKAKVVERSTRLKPSYISPDHFLVQATNELGIETFGSATMSDQAFMSFPTIKMGPGVSKRSHTPNEFIKISEIKEGIDIYIKFLKALKI